MWHVYRYRYIHNHADHSSVHVTHLLGHLPAGRVRGPPQTPRSNPICLHECWRSHILRLWARALEHEQTCLCRYLHACADICIWGPLTWGSKITEVNWKLGVDEGSARWISGSILRISYCSELEIRGRRGSVQWISCSVLRISYCIVNIWNIYCAG